MLRLPCNFASLKDQKWLTILRVLWLNLHRDPRWPGKVGTYRSSSEYGDNMKKIDDNPNPKPGHVEAQRFLCNNGQLRRRLLEVLELGEDS